MARLQKVQKPQATAAGNHSKATGSPAAPQMAQGALAAKKAGVGPVAQPEPLSKQLLQRFRGFQTGLDLSTRGGYRLAVQLAAGTQGDVFDARVPAEQPLLGGRTEVAIKRVRVTNAAIQRHTVQEFTTVFAARMRYAKEVNDEAAPGHPRLASYLDWFAGPSGLDREVCLVMEKCDFAVNDILYTVGQARVTYEKRFAEMAKQHRSSGSPAAAAARLRAAAAAGAPAFQGPDPLMYRFPESEVLKVMQHLLSALSFLNRHGIMHRDIKTDNILWKYERPEGTYKLADFGTSLILAEGEQLAKHQECGTLWTMAPELLCRRPEHGFNCDVWSLGCVLFEVAVLDKPFNSKELLALKNSEDASQEGAFWQFLCPPPATPAGGLLGGAANAAMSGSATPTMQRAATATSAARLIAGKSRARPSTQSSLVVASKMSLSKSSPSLRSTGSRKKKSSADGANTDTMSLTHPDLGESKSFAATAPAAPLEAAESQEAEPTRDRAAEATAGTKEETGEDCAKRAGAEPVPGEGDSLTPLAEGGQALLGGLLAGRGDGGAPTGLRPAPLGAQVLSSTASSPTNATRNAEKDAALQARKLQFLRRRCNGRWCYSDELRSLLFEDFLDEDMQRRPSAQQARSMATVISLFERHHLNPDVTPRARSGQARLPEAPPAAASSDATSEGADVVGAELRVVTGENFRLAILAEREKQRALMQGPGG
eukprot:TRINITY_DN21958_c1_g3_i3.p1 TRINITY_DN21958_c1_g3~~TRINITY_DN21958_c1_g3_i3.p1  ORF type:complete len:712 (-),score=179.51 TRINITY_DN21958_c1_g3_i3:97-2232(-)